MYISYKFLMKTLNYFSRNSCATHKYMNKFFQPLLDSRSLFTRQNERTKYVISQHLWIGSEHVYYKRQYLKGIASFNLYTIRWVTKAQQEPNQKRLKQQKIAATRMISLGSQKPKGHSAVRANLWILSLRTIRFNSECWLNIVKRMDRCCTFSRY